MARAAQTAKALTATALVVLIDAVSLSTRRLFGVSGRLGGLTWSPDGSRLLLAWPEADQWLFVPTGRAGRVRAIGGISASFEPGTGAGRARFPRVAGWCCPPGTAGG